MTTNGIFNIEPDTLNPSSPVDNVDETNLLDTLVGEGRKFKDVQALAKGKIVADAFIEQLKEELSTLRAEQGERKRIDELMTEFRKVNQPQGGSTEYLRNASVVPPETETEVLDANALTERILNQLDVRARTRVESENVDKVRNRLKEEYGLEWQKKLVEFTNSFGMDQDTMEAWIKKNPEAVLSKVIPNTANKPIPGFSTPGVSTGTLPNKSSGIRDWAYYQALKAKDPKAYWSADIQVQMHQDALKYKGDFFPKE